MPRDIYAEALARSKEGMSLSKAQKDALASERTKMRQFKSSKAADGLRKAKPGGDNLK